MTARKDLFRRLREQAERTRAAAPRTLPSSRALAAIDLRERIENRIRPVLDGLRESLPELQPLRRTDSGTWVLGLVRPLSADDRAARAARPFSRLEFLVDVTPDLGTCAVTIRGTTFDRDLPSRTLVFRLDELSDERLDALAEEACVDFARRWHVAAEEAGRRRIEAEAELLRHAN